MRPVAKPATSDRETRSATEALAALVLERPIDDGARASAALLVADALISMLGGRATEPGRMISGWARATGVDRSTSGRALVAAALGHVLELDDLHRTSVTHPGCVVVGTALALADARTGARAWLDAVVRGYEAMIRLGEAVGRQHYRTFHSTATCGPFGAAATAASLLGLDARRLTWAFGNAATTAAGLWEFNREGVMSKHLHTGHAAFTGTAAAELAAAGFTGARHVLEGPQGFFAGLCPDPAPERLVAGADAGWRLGETSLKPWPSCRHTHPAIQCALALRAAAAQTARPAAAPRTITVATYRAALDVCDRPRPVNGYQARFSLQHCVAATLLHGAPTLASLSDQAVRDDAATAALAPAVSLEVAPDLEAAYPAHWGARLELELEGGARLAHSVRDARGDPEAPLGWAELADKARAVAGAAAPMAALLGPLEELAGGAPAAAGALAPIRDAVVALDLAV